MPDRFCVTVELWTVYRAAYGDDVKRWALVHNGTPLVALDETEMDARDRARSWGWEIHDAPDDETDPTDE